MIRKYLKNERSKKTHERNKKKEEKTKRMKKMKVEFMDEKNSWMKIRK